MARQLKADSHTVWGEGLAGLVFLVLGCGLFAAAMFWRSRFGALGPLLLYLSAPSLVAAAGFLPAWLTAYARKRGRLPRRTPTERTGKPLPMMLEKARVLGDRLWAALRNVDWVGDWLAILAALLPALLALYTLWRVWHAPAMHPGAVTEELTVGVLMVSAFVLLVLERRTAAIAPATLPEAPDLAQLLRVPLLAAVGLAVAAGLRWLGLAFAAPIEKFVAVVTALVAIELVARCAVFLFLPWPALANRTSPAKSSLARLIRAEIPNLTAINASVRSQFGIDLARSWSLMFLRRAMLPLLAGMVLFAWILSGFTALGTGERAVYESFGRPRAVLYPGIHVHLPWPFATLRLVPFGQVREISVDTSGNASLATMAAIEGEAPVSADRLWDSGQEESSYLVANLSDGRQSFEAVDIDISVAYRIGLSDDDAIRAAYHLADPDAAVRSVSSQILAHYFARNTIEAILGQNREAFMADFQKSLQARLTALDSGIEVMAVVVEGIHPPPKAAASYQNVQASVMDSTVKVNTARAEAAREMKMASVVANATRNDAISAAAERMSKAKTDAILFEGERMAYAAGGPSFLLERRLEKFSHGLSDKPLIILDHRIAATEAPTFDMRQLQRPRNSFGDPGAD